MKICIVCAHFMEEIGYFEVHLANNLVKLNHEVFVITSTSISPEKFDLVKMEYKEGWNYGGKNRYRILRLKPILKFASSVITWDFKNNIDHIKPDAIIVIGIAKIFPIWVYKYRDKEIITYFGDNSDYQLSNSGSVFARFIKNLLNGVKKTVLYNIAIKYSYKIIGYTPETLSVLQKKSTKRNVERLKFKYVNSTLGFDGEIFYCSNKERVEVRDNLKISNETFVILTSTRITRDKKIEKIIDLTEYLVDKGVKVFCIVIGFQQDTYEKELLDYIDSKKLNSKFLCVRFASKQEIRRFYNSADIGIWFRAAISIQEAMGTGLPIYLESKSSTCHLITENENGYYYQDGDYKRLLFELLVKFREMNLNRNKVSHWNQKFCYRNIIKTHLLENLNLK